MGVLASSDIIGAVSNEVVRVGTTHYFVSEDNFYAYDTASVNLSW